MRRFYLFAGFLFWIALLLVSLPTEKLWLTVISSLFIVTAIGKIIYQHQKCGYSWHLILTGENK